MVLSDKKFNFDTEEELLAHDVHSDDDHFGEDDTEDIITFIDEGLSIQHDPYVLDPINWADKPVPNIVIDDLDEGTRLEPIYQTPEKMPEKKYKRLRKLGDAPSKKKPSAFKHETKLKIKKKQEKIKQLQRQIEELEDELEVKAFWYRSFDQEQ